MSASEKLKALVEGAAPYAERGEAGNENVLAYNLLADSLVGVRRQIVAVVEAAEKGAAHPHAPAFQKDVAATLAALDKALS